MRLRTVGFLLLGTLLGACAPGIVVKPPPRPGFELGVNIHMDAGPRVAAVPALGADWVRVDLSWDSLEAQPGRWDFRQADATLDNARALGLKVYATLAYAPAWACAGGARNCVPNSAAWERFVGTVAARYRDRVDAFGIWNEPNLEEFWLGSAEDYARVLLIPAARVIHTVAPGVLVAGPDLAHLYAPRLDTQHFFQVLRQTGADQSLDVISHHLYGGADFAQKLDGFHFGPLLYRKGLKQMLASAGLEQRPVWITEWGQDARAVGEAAQARNLREQLRALRAEAWIRKVFVFQLSDDNDPEHQWGLLRDDGSARPAVKALRDALAPSAMTGLPEQ